MKTEGQKREEKLTYVKQNYFETSSKEEIAEMYAYAENYKKFLDESKTEREACAAAERMATAAGFSRYQLGDELHAGDKKYYVNRNKSIVVFRIGTLPLEQEGIRIIASHIDCPRLDIKQNPLYEKDGMAFLKTHYYGGIKKYQWTALPLALHGVVCLKDGTVVQMNIGEKEDDPVFYINDLLPHLGAEQMAKTASKVIEGEDLNVVIGGLPFADKEVKEKIRLTVLAELNERFGIVEEDFLSAELSAVPALKAKDVGLDRALIAAYGHDDRVCSYPALTALLDTDTERTVMAMLVDKEEIGSEGVTGLQSAVYEDLIEEICDKLNANVRKVRALSGCLSADVTAAYDPNFANAFERQNSSLLSCGTTICKFTGSRGKGGANDANAEFLAKVRKIFAENNVVWQTAELGKVDFGGGGTVAKFTAELNIDTVDIGVPVISMHAPYELVSKADLFSTYKALCAFLK